MNNLIWKIYYKTPIFIQNILLTFYGFYLYNQRFSGQFDYYIKELKKTEWLPAEELQEIQNTRLKKIIKHCYENVPYYKALFKKIGLHPKKIETVEDLPKIPILEKSYLKTHLKEFIAENISKGKLIPYTTGGTTGTPLTLFMTKESIRYNFAANEVRHKYWANVKLGDKLATFLGKPIVSTKTNKPPFWRRNKMFNQTLFSSFHQSEDNMKYYVEELNKLRPEIIQGYPSNIFILANYILNNKLTVFSPKAILVTSETLFDWQRDIIEKAFNCRVYINYGAAEFVALITECEKGGLHISPEYGVIELIKNQNVYEAICTTLFNFSVPLIRYRIGDIIMPAEKEICSCGRKLPLVGSVLGRVDDMIITPEGHFIGSASLSLVFQEARNIREAQLVQISPQKIIARIVKEKEFSQDNLNFIEKELRLRLGEDILIDFEFPERIERTKEGKYRFIISNLSKNILSKDKNTSKNEH